MAVRNPKQNRVVVFFRGVFLENLGLKLFSFLIALLLWLFVLGAEDVTSTVDIPLFFKLPEDKVMVTDVPNKVTITVTGPWASIKSWNPKDLEVEINLVNADIGPTVVYLEENRFRLAPGLKLTRVNPAQLTVNLAKKSTKIVPIVPVIIGKPGEGYVIKSITNFPEKIEIEGAESDIMIVDEVLTEEIDVTGRSQSFTVTTTPVRLSKNITFPNKEPIEVSISMKRDLLERLFDMVNVEVRSSKHLARTEPESLSLTLMGPRDQIEKLKLSSVRAFVDASKEEGDVPNTETVREVEFDPLPAGIKIKSGVYTVKLKISNTLKDTKGSKAPSKDEP